MYISEAIQHRLFYVHSLPQSISNRRTHYIMCCVFLHCTVLLSDVCIWLVQHKKMSSQDKCTTACLLKNIHGRPERVQRTFSQHKQNSCYVIYLASKIKQAVWFYTGILNLPTLTAPHNHVAVVWWCHSKPLCLVCFNLVLQIRVRKCFKGVSVSN